MEENPYNPPKEPQEAPMPLDLPDTFTALERSVLLLLLDGSGEPFESIVAQFSRVTVSSREFTGVGGYTNFTMPPDAPFVGLLPTMELSCWGAHPQLTHGALFILFLREGCVSFLEFVTMDGPWPADESLFTLSPNDQTHGSNPTTH